MSKHGIFPFTFDAWDESDPDMILLYEVNWLEDFGPFKKGQQCSSLFIDYGEGHIQLTDEDGKIVMKTKFKCVPVEE